MLSIHTAVWWCFICYKKVWSKEKHENHRPAALFGCSIANTTDKQQHPSCSLAWIPSPPGRNRWTQHRPEYAPQEPKTLPSLQVTETAIYMDPQDGHHVLQDSIIVILPLVEKHLTWQKHKTSLSPCCPWTQGRERHTMGWWMKESILWQGSTQTGWLCGGWEWTHCWGLTLSWREIHFVELKVGSQTLVKVFAHLMLFHSLFMCWSPRPRRKLYPVARQQTNLIPRTCPSCCVGHFLLSWFCFFCLPLFRNVDLLSRL